MPNSGLCIQYVIPWLEAKHWFVCTLLVPWLEACPWFSSSLSENSLLWTCGSRAEILRNIAKIYHVNIINITPKLNGLAKLFYSCINQVRMEHLTVEIRICLNAKKVFE